MSIFFSRHRFGQQQVTATSAIDSNETRTGLRGTASTLFDVGNRIVHHLLPSVPKNTMATSGDEADVSSVGEEASFHSDNHHGNRNRSDDELAAALHYIWTLKQTKRENRLSSRRVLLERDSSSRRTVYSQNYSRQASVTRENTPLMGNSSVIEESKTDEQDTNENDKKDINFDDQESMSLRDHLSIILFGKGIVSWCMLAMPLSLFAVFHQWSDTWIFWLNFLALIPLAAFLGEFTEEVALHTNELTGGLINASFGNAVEVVVAIQALLANEIRVVQASLLGSILSNLLLVLGCCFFFGGLFHREQKFNSTVAVANMGLLALSSIALVLPTPFAEYYDLHDERVLIVSRITALFLIFMYAQLLIFQLVTHSHIFNSDNSGEEESPTLSLSASIVGLVTVTILVAFFSDFLVASIEGFTEATGISRTFVGLILLPIIGNAVEHVSAVSVAMKNKMDLSMGIAVGSCTQISLFVVPLTVISGWVMDKDMTLNFPHFEIVLYILSVFTVSIVCSHPTCNWLEGSLLITTYCLIALGFWFESVKDF